MTISIEWKGAGRKATQPPNPGYPKGIVVRGKDNVPACKAIPKYPAPECGVWLLECSICGSSIAVTAAGRIDDPCEIWVPCKTALNETRH